MMPPPPRSTLFPYTTLFRSWKPMQARMAEIAERLSADRYDEERAFLAWLLERSEEHTSELQSHSDLVCRLLLEKKKQSEAQTASRVNQACSLSAAGT